MGIFALLVLYAVALGILVDPQVVRESTAWVPYCLAAAGMAGLLAHQIRWLRQHGRKETLLHPVVYVTGWFLIMIALPGLLGFWNHELTAELEEVISINYAFAAYGMILALGGLVAIWAGYILGLRIFRSSRSLSALRLLDDITPGAIFGLYAVTVAVRLIGISVTGFAFGADRSQLGGYQAFHQWLGYTEEFRWLVLAVVALKAFRGEWSKVPFAIVCSMEVMYAFTSGFMKPMLWLLLVLSITAAYAGFRFTKAIPYAIAGLALAITIVPVTEHIRKDFSFAGGFDARSLSAIFSSVGNGFRSTWGNGFNVGWEIFEQKMLAREAIVAQSPGIVISQTPSTFAFEGFGELWRDVIASFIPRVVWPSKPEVTRGVWFSHAYLNIPESIETSSAPTIFGETYWYYGWPATIAAMLFLGIFFACLYRNTVGVGLVPLFASLVPNLEIEGQFTVLIVSVTQRFFIGIVVIWVLSLLSRQLRSHHDAAFGARRHSADLPRPVQLAAPLPSLHENS